MVIGAYTMGFPYQMFVDGCGLERRATTVCCC